MYYFLDVVGRGWGGNDIVGSLLLICFLFEMICIVY